MQIIRKSKVKVSQNDTTADFLESKIVAGTGVSLSTASEGGDEAFTIALDATGLSDEKVKADQSDIYAGTIAEKMVFSNGLSSSTAAMGTGMGTVITVSSDGKTKVSSNDVTYGFLESKLSAGTSIVFSTANEGDDESLTISVTGVSEADEKVKVDADDSTAGYLYTKLVEGTNIAFSTSSGSPTGSMMTIGVTGVSAADEKIKITGDDTTAGYLATKLIAGTGITLSTADSGGATAEWMTIATSSTHARTLIEWTTDTITGGAANSATGTATFGAGVTSVDVLALSVDPSVATQERMVFQLYSDNELTVLEYELDTQYDLTYSVGDTIRDPIQGYLPICSFYNGETPATNAVYWKMINYGTANATFDIDLYYRSM